MLRLSTSLRARVFVTLLPFLLLSAGLGATGTVLLSHLGGQIDQILRENYASVVAMERLNEALERIDSSFQFAMAGQAAAAANQFDENWHHYREALRVEQHNITLPGERERVMDLNDLTARYRAQADAFYARTAEDTQRRSAYFGPGGLLETFRAIKLASGAIRELNQANMQQASARAKTTATFSTLGLAAGLAGAVVVSLLLLWSVNRALVRPIRALTTSAVRISEGRLEDQHVEYRALDELGELARAFNHMVDQLSAARRATEVTIEQLRRAEQGYRNIFENAVEGIFQSTPDGRYLAANQALADMLGYASGSDLITSIHHIGEQVYADPAVRIEFKRRLVHDGVVRGFEALCVRKDKTTLWLSYDARAVRDASGAVEMYEGFVSDVSARKKAEHEVARLAHLQATVAELGTRALRLPTSVDIASEAVGLIAAALGVELVNVLEALPGGKSFRLHAGDGWAPDKIGVATIPAEGTQPGFTLRADRPVVVEDVSAEMRFAPLAGLLDEHVASSMSVVIPMQKGAYGTLGVHARQRRSFTHDEVDFLQSIANVLGAAIERRLGERALATSELNLNRAQEIAHVGSWQLDVPGNRLTWSDEVYRIFGLPKTNALSYDTFLAAVHPDDRECVDQAWAAALRGASYDIEHRIVVPGAPELGLKWVHERAEVSCDAGGQAIEGIGTVQDVTERRLAHERLERLNRAHHALSACNHALVRETDEQHWMSEICRVVVEEAGYRLCWVGRAQDDPEHSVRAIAAAGFDEGYLASLRVSWADDERGRGPTGICIRTGRVVLTQHIDTDPRFAPWRAEALRRGYGSSIAIPILVDGRAFGALNIYAHEPDAFADAEVALLSELAADLAYGIGALRTRTERDHALDELRALNAELEARVEHRTADLRAAREREASIGARIQRELLLDQPPRDVPGLQVAALTVPSQHIAGDFYGFFRHEDRDCVDVLVADVMGKGVPAALLAAAAKSHFPEALWHLMSTFDSGALPEPHAIVTLVHTHLAHQLLGIESFVTACYARIDVAARRLKFVDCGHTGLLHVRARTGACELLHGDNLPLGVREGELYGQTEIALEADDLLVFYSDGVSEARSPDGELFGVERLADCVRQHVSATPEQLVERVRDAVVAYTGARGVGDDLTCVVTKLVAYEVPRARAHLELGSRLEELVRARRFVEKFCLDAAGRPLVEDEIASLVLATNEATSNIIKHAYLGREDQYIEIAAEAFPGRITVRLRYQGSMFEPGAVAPPAFDGSRDSGFGVFVIASSVDTVRYYRDDLRRCCVLLEKRGGATRLAG